MIKLIVNPRAERTSYTFNKPVIVIGAVKGPEVDLSLSHEKLEPAHVKIMEQGNRFIVINQANDPFVTINGIPFGKKAIHSNDILEIGSTQILFEGTSTPSQNASVKIDTDRGIADTAVELPALLEKVLTKKGKEVAQTVSPTQHTPSFESVHQNPIENTEQEFDLESEMQQLDAWLQETAHLSPAPTEEELAEVEAEQQTLFDEDDLFEQPSFIEDDAPVPARKQNLQDGTPKPQYKQTIKDLYFKELEEDYQAPPSRTASSATSQAESTTMDWHTIWIIMVGVLSTIILIALLLYANASGKSEDEELRAAEGVADVAMALTYAQFNNIIPQNQNWSDPEFLKNNLTSVLAAEYPALAQLDSHGQFSNSPYLLRIYTSSDLSDFLVIAQPAPSVLQWLIPKTTILVYSKDMELRKTIDLKSLNRILVNPSLDGSVAKDVSNIVKKAEIISLSSISKRQHRLGFSPPKALALIRPGAENRIYNAPRYYNFGESVMQKAVFLAENQENSNEISMLKNEIKTLTGYPNFVMYSSQGLQAAIQAQKALALFEPDAKFLIAYLQFNAHGVVQSSHLLIDDNSEDLAMKEVVSPLRNSALAPLQIQRSTIIAQQGDTSDADITHPLYFQLSALAANRQQVLKPISHEITTLLDVENQQALPDFQEKFRTLSSRYLTANEEQQARIVRGITHLYQERHIALHAKRQWQLNPLGANQDHVFRDFRE